VRPPTGNKDCRQFFLLSLDNERYVAKMIGEIISSATHNTVAQQSLSTPIRSVSEPPAVRFEI